MAMTCKFWFFLNLVFAFIWLVFSSNVTCDDDKIEEICSRLIDKRLREETRHQTGNDLLY